MEQHRPEIGVNAGEQGMSFVDSRQTSASQEAPAQPAASRGNPRPEGAVPERELGAQQPSGSRAPEEAPTVGARRSAAAAFGAAENHGPDAAEVVASRHVPTPATATR